MKERIFQYIKKRKLLVIILVAYIVLSVFLIVFLYLKGDQTFFQNGSFSPLASLNKRTEQNNSPGKNSAKNSNIKDTVNNSSDSSTSDSQDSDSSNNDDKESSDPESPSSPSNDLTAVVAFYADTQEDTDEEDENHERVISYILGTGANPVFHAGDIMEDGTQNSLDRFDIASQALRDARTFYAALGNNDRVVGDSSTPSSMWLDFFSFPGNERWYSVNIGNLHMIILDSAFSSIAPGSTQYNWLINDLESEASQSRITGVMYHHPSFSSSISSILTSKHVDFSVAGHIHTYGQSISDGVRYFTLSGQPAIGYIIAKIYSQNVQILVYDSGNSIIDSAVFANR